MPKKKTEAPKVNTADGLLKFQVKLDTSRTYDIDFNRELEVNFMELTEEILNQPSKFAWFSTLYQMARDLERRTKQRLERVAAGLDLELRQSPPEDVKLTETTIKNLVTTDPDYQRWLSKYNEIQFQVGVLYEWRQSMADRKEMLVSANVNLRKEFEHGS